MKVVILAGGRGTRISEEIHLKPKPMTEIGGEADPLAHHEAFFCSRTERFRSLLWVQGPWTLCGMRLCSKNCGKAVMLHGEFGMRMNRMTAVREVILHKVQEFCRKVQPQSAAAAWSL